MKILYKNIKKNVSMQLIYKGFILFFVMLFLMTACELEKKGESEEIISDTEATVTEQEPQPFPLTIAGIEIKESPESIICLSPPLTEIIYELGFGDKLIGRGSYCDYPPAVVNVTDAGSSANPDISKILSTSPDIVLTQTPIADKDLFLMEQAGITTIVLPSPKSLNEFKGIYRSLGLLFNGAFTGIEYGDEAFSQISKACDNSEVLDIGDFVYITEGLSVAALDTLESAVLSCFGSNLAISGTGYDFSKDSLLENQPDVILLSDKYNISDLKNDEIYSQLEAVENEKIIYINNVYFERPTKRLITMIEKFATDFAKLL